MSIANVIDIKKYIKVLKITSLLLIFIHKVSAKTIDKNAKLQALVKAEQLWLIEVQTTFVMRKDFGFKKTARFIIWVFVGVGGELTFPMPPHTQ